MQIDKRAVIRASVFMALVTFLSQAAEADGGFNALSDMFTYNGFGTAAVARTDTNEAEFVNSGQNLGATENFDYRSDSKLGLQGTVSPTTWLSGTVQVLSEERYSDHLSTDIEWAYAKVTPLAGLSVRAGQLALPTYLVSDSRNVGYANTWLRAPDEVYGQSSFDTYKGFDIAYQHAIGKYTLTVGALAGHTAIDYMLEGFDSIIYAHRLRGYNASLDTGDVTVRASRVTTDLDVMLMGPEIASLVYTFDSLGVTYNHGNVVAQGEFIEKRTGTAVAYNVNGWYVLGGYRFGKWLPYGIYAGGMQPSEAGGTDKQYNRDTLSAGLRYEVTGSVDVKAQFDRVKAYAAGSVYINFVDIQPDWDHKADVFSIAVDFVF
jgi:hypothetical protein